VATSIRWSNPKNNTGSRAAFSPPGKLFFSLGGGVAKAIVFVSAKTLPNADLVHAGMVTV
jgi:hypothetical protein